ncbi:hypothetical protein AB0M43_33730 [Longispora sp. NPDC051575]|uniref:hypothetical protein n=1 Tax=Longispora sp. NPDC051575 TaxID=3154943 RepID=UPI003427E4E2
MPALMQEHPGWTATPTGYARVMRSGRDVWLLTWRQDGPGTVNTEAVGATSGTAPTVDVFDPAPVRDLFGPLGAGLVEAGPVIRVRNVDLWDAVGTAINRQVITAAQARKTYELFCSTHGEPVPTSDGDLFLFPTAERVAELPDEAFDRLGMKFKRPMLRAAAAAYLDHGDAWAHLAPDKLAEALLAVHRIGPWTAGAAVADWSHEFALYPYWDMAVRHWARTTAPGIDWPTSDKPFGALWRAGAGEHLSVLTLLTLAQGGARSVNGTT